MIGGGRECLACNSELALESKPARSTRAYASPREAFYHTCWRAQKSLSVWPRTATLLPNLKAL